MLGPYTWPSASDAGGKSERERERLERDEGSSEPDEDVLSQKLSPYTQPHPPSLSLTPSGPWGSQFWSLRLFPLVAPDQLSDFTICKKWLLFKVKFCLQKVHLKQVLPLLSFSVFMFLFLVSFIAQTSFSHSSVHLLSVRGTFCGFLPPFLALNLTKRERMSVFRLLNLSLIPHKPVQICSLHRSTTFTFIMHSWCLDASFFQAMTLNVSGASVDDSCSEINHLFSTHREQRRVGGEAGCLRELRCIRWAGSKISTRKALNILLYLHYRSKDWDL